MLRNLHITPVTASRIPFPQKYTPNVGKPVHCNPLALDIQLWAPLYSSLKLIVLHSDRWPCEAGSNYMGLISGKWVFEDSGFDLPAVFGWTEKGYPVE